MKNKKFLFSVLLLVTMFFSTSIIYAKEAVDSGCTHTVYSTSSPGTYHYYYCSICGKCNKRVAHSTSWVSNYRERYVP